MYLPLTCWARVEVKREHADIFALTVERTGRLQVVKGDKNREGNRRMADRHRGVKPAWTRTNQVFEKSCGNGRKQWQSFADAVKEAEKLNRGRKK